MDVEGMLADEERRWQELHALFEQIPSERFREPVETSQGWSPKDVMFHIGCWLAECARVLTRMREGSYVPDDEEAPGYVERFNRERLELSKTMDAGAVRASFDEARVRARAQFATMPDPDGKVCSWFEESGPLHYLEHMKDLQPGLKGDR